MQARRSATVLHDVEWRIAPGERTGILGVNGAGKSTLLGLVAGAVAADDRAGQARQDRQGRHAQPASSPSSTECERTSA